MLGDDDLPGLLQVTNTTATMYCYNGCCHNERTCQVYSICMAGMELDGSSCCVGQRSTSAFVSSKQNASVCVALDFTPLMCV